MADAAKAAANTMLILRKELGIELDAARDPAGKSLRHQIWLLQQVEAGEVTGDEAMHWLAFAQGALVAGSYITLDACKFAVALS